MPSCPIDEKGGMCVSASEWTRYGIRPSAKTRSTMTPLFIGNRGEGVIVGGVFTLKAYRRNPTTARKAALQTRFDRIFTSRTGFATLDRLLARLHANKSELLKVLDRPEIPLYTNGSENDIRCQVIRRKISGGTRSDAGRDCCDAFLGLAKTCAKLGIAFWDYLGARLLVPGSATIPFLPEIVSVRAGQPP
jgi:hypothetical protein